MSENRNNFSGCSQDQRGVICIDTHRVLDSCRDRDCFENARVYLTSGGEQLLSSATNVRATSASILWANVTVDDVPFNCGFFRVSVRYYILIDLEACVGIGRSQKFKGLSVVEKDVILFGGEGNSVSFSSTPGRDFCSIGNPDSRSTNEPVAVVETVEPIILGTKVVDCSCPCPAFECIELPECVCGCLDDEIKVYTDNTRLYISFGIFSVIRLLRPAQILVQGTDYSVPDKECVPASNDEDPCALFQSMQFPAARFSGGKDVCERGDGRNGKGGGCGCQKR